METIQENEQWKLSGDCTKCRRNNYCSKPCTRYNRRARAEMKRLVADWVEINKQFTNADEFIQMIPDYGKIKL